MNPYRNRDAVTTREGFIGRKDILADCLGLISGGDVPQNVSLYGDRWAGKSSVLRHLQTRLIDAGGRPEEYLCVYLDVQGIGTPRTFFSRLSRELAAAAQASLGAIDDSPATLIRIVTTISRRFKIVALLDGFDSITRNPNFSVEFFSFLRSVPVTDGSRLGWTLTSARPLRDMCHSPQVQGSPFFNIFSDRLLGAFTTDETYELVVGRSSAAGFSLDPYASAIEQLTGRFPLFVQMACCYAFDQGQANHGRVDFAGVAQKFREEARPYIEHLWWRLSPGERDVLALVASGGSVEGHPVRTLRDLVRRGYLIGPSLDSGLYEFDCQAFLEHVRRVAMTRTPPAGIVMPKLDACDRTVLPLKAASEERVRVFISYSHRNKRAFRQIFDFICSLSKDGIDFWFDERLRAGDLWDERIRSEIARADIALVLVSQEYFTSKYCMDVEASEFMQARLNAGMVIFPILLSPCPVEDHDWLFRTHRVPREGTFASVTAKKAKRDALLLEILKELREVARAIRESHQPGQASSSAELGV